MRPCTKSKEWSRSAGTRVSLCLSIDRQECLIKWKGYDDCYNSWEPQEHITLFYKYFPEEEKEEDPEYTENVSLPSNNAHNYHTRNKKKKGTN